MSMQSRPGGGRVVLLTGAAGGIGTAITQALLGDGHFVAAVDKSESALSRLSLVCGRSDVSERLCPILADLADAAACLDAVAAAAARFGRVDAVINNAGIGVSSLRPDAVVIRRSRNLRRRSGTGSSTSTCARPCWSPVPPCRK